MNLVFYSGKPGKAQKSMFLNSNVALSTMDLHGIGTEQSPLQTKNDFAHRKLYLFANQRWQFRKKNYLWAHESQDQEILQNHHSYCKTMTLRGLG